MKWTKKGQIFEGNGTLERSRTHVSIPIARHLDGDRYRVYFSSRDNLNRSQIDYIEIDIRNPRHVLRWSKDPVLGPGELGTFDDSGAMGSWITEHGSSLYLYYIGWNLGITVPFRNAIGLAISNDGGVTFTRYSKGPILDRHIHDPCFVASNCVLIEDRKWRMWYLSATKWKTEDRGLKHYYHIKYAESNDGIQWERKGIVCIDFASEEEYAVSRPCVLKDREVYRMWYSYRGQNYRIGYAESGDGIRWERKDQEAGIDVSKSGWDSEMIEYPFVFDHGGQRYMLYNGNGYGESGVGLAVLEK